MWSIPSPFSLPALLLQVFPSLPGHFLSAGRVLPISIFVSLSSQTVAAHWSASTVPRLRLGLARKLSVPFSGTYCEKHPVCSVLYISAPYSKMVFNLVLKMPSLVLELHFYDFQRGLSVAKELLKRASLRLMSASVPSCLSTRVCTEVGWCFNVF